MNKLHYFIGDKTVGEPLLKNLKEKTCISILGIFHLNSPLQEKRKNKKKVMKTEQYVDDIQ